LFVIVTRRTGFGLQWEAVFARRNHQVLRLDGPAQLESCLGAGTVQLAVIDFDQPGYGDPELIRRLHRQSGTARLIAAGITFTPQAELAALASGVVAACDQTLRHDELTRIVDVVMQGGIWISRTGIPLLVGKLQGLSPRASTAPKSDPMALLSPREREVAEMVGRGASNKTIGDALAISDRTVKSHLTTIFGKLNVPDRLQLALYVTGNGRSGDSV
jgi:two-component system, NarL family, nitrate/nitrite response regulator NarL